MTIKNTVELRNLLLGQLEGLTDDMKTSTKLNAASKAMREIMNSVNVELLYAKAKGVPPKINFLESNENN